MRRPGFATLFKTAAWIIFGAIAYRGLFETLREFDTSYLTEGASVALTCLKNGVWFGCSQPKAQTWHFPLLQYLPSLGFLALGATPARAARILGYASVFYFLGTFFLMERALKQRSERAATLGLFILLTSPFLWYATSSFGEMGAAFLTLFFISRCVQERYSVPAVIGSFVLAGITKEVAFPFLFLLGLLANPGVRQAGALAVGAVITVTLNAGFNLFRFGAIGNTINLNPLFRVTELKTQLSFAAAIWLSPSGGLAFFWTSFVLFLLWVGWVSLGAPNPGQRNWIPCVGAWGMLGGLTAGFSKWYSPMGYVAWGPRLILPWIPAISFLLLRAYSGSVEKGIRALTEQKKVFWAIFTVLFLCALPQFMVMLQPDLKEPFFVGVPGCNDRAAIDIDPAVYYSCVDSLLWNQRWTLKVLYRAAFTPALLVFTVVYGILLAGLWKSLGKESGDADVVKA